MKKDRTGTIYLQGRGVQTFLRFLSSKRRHRYNDKIIRDLPARRINSRSPFKH